MFSIDKAHFATKSSLILQKKSLTLTGLIPYFDSKGDLLTNQQEAFFVIGLVIHSDRSLPVTLNLFQSLTVFYYVKLNV